jgi:O-antigen/teichoic acid export membrane protein
LGLVSKQAYSNTINIVIGTIAGAINTIIVLPLAFSSSLDDWGLIKLILSFAMILSPIFGFGVNNIIVREYSQDSEKNKSVLGFALLVGIAGSMLLFLFVSFNGLDFFINEENASLIHKNLFYIIVLSISLTIEQVFSGFITAIHKSPLIQFINDSFLKVTFLLLSLYYLFFPFQFELFVLLYIATYLADILIYAIYSKVHGFALNFKFKDLNLKSLLNYGFYTVLDRGASIIVANLDLIMIAYLLDLADVAIYGLAFFMAAVILIPQKAIMTPSYPLVSKAVREDKKEDLFILFKQSSINQIIIGGSLFVLIWSSIHEIFSLIPKEFEEGIWVVFYIGLSRLFMLSTGVSGAIIVFSKYYRANLYFNLFLVVITIVSNYFLINAYGMTGAAMATALSFLIYNLLKTIYIKHRFDLQPFTIESLKSLLILVVIGVLGSQISILSDLPFISIIIKSALITLLLVIGFYSLKVNAEILDLPLKIFKRFKK